MSGHIGRKIVEGIKDDLEKRYGLCLGDDEYSPFCRSMDGTNDLEINERQEIALCIIEKILDYHGKTEILKFLKELAFIEHGIQEIQPKVRDHVVHAVNTFFLGVYIENCVGFPFSNKSVHDPEFQWKLTGATHDLGYPVEISRNIERQFIDKMNEILNRIPSDSPRVMNDPIPANLGALCKGRNAEALIQQRLIEWNLDINIPDYYEHLKLKNLTDHGVIGALSQLKVIDALYQHYNPERKKGQVVHGGYDSNEVYFEQDIVSASASLFIHNISDDYSGFANKIDLGIAPFAFLLYLCDTFQEWDRFGKNRKEYYGASFDIDCTERSIELKAPVELENRIRTALKNRLKGFCISVNGVKCVD